MWEDFKFCCLRTIKDLKTLLSTPGGWFNLSLGIFWVFFYIFIRFFRNVTGYKIIELHENISVLLFLSFVFFILINFMVLLRYAVNWYKKKYSKETSKLMNFFNKIFSSNADIFFWQPLDTLYKLVNIPGIGKFFLFLEKRYFLCSCSRDTDADKGFISYLLIFLFDVFPRLLLPITFFVEVIFYGQVLYFLFLLPILFLPILFKFILKQMESFGTNLVTGLCEYFSTITPLSEERKVYNSFTVAYAYEGAMDSRYLGVIDPQEDLKLILRAQNVLIQAYFIKREQEKISDYVSIFIALLYFTAGIVRLCLVM